MKILNALPKERKENGYTAIYQPDKDYDDLSFLGSGGLYKNNLTSTKYLLLH